MTFLSLSQEVLLLSLRRFCFSLSGGSASLSQEVLLLSLRRVLLLSLRRVLLLSQEGSASLSMRFCFSLNEVLLLSQ
jgi:hypothetical protein